MQDLTLVGVHDDGEHLVLSGPDGQRFRVQVDEQLRAAVRRDRARLGQLQIEHDGRLRPRDIQARIRAGQTAEEIAEAANLPIEHVRRYEGPVLAEREFVVRQARAVRIRRPAGSRAESGTGPGGSPTLGDLVAERLAAREVLEAESTWDAWRSDEGAWLVALTFTAGSKERRATWTYDAQLRHVSAQDDEARWLTEDVVPQPVSTPRRLVPIRSADPLRAEGTVHDRIYDVEADGGVRPAVDVRDDDRTGGAAAAHHRTGAHQGAHPGHPAGQGSGAFGSGKGSGSGSGPAPSATVDLLDSLRERRGRRNRAASTDDGTDPFESRQDPFDSGPEPFESAPAAIWAIEPGFDDAEPPAAHPPHSRPELAVDAELLELPDGGAALVPSRRGEAGHPSSAFAAGSDDLLFDAAPTGRRSAGGTRRDSAATTSAPAEPTAPGPATPPATSPAAAAAAHVPGGQLPGVQLPGAPIPAAPAATLPPVTPTPATAAPARRNKRASVPSWDDIVFGSRRE